MHQNSFDIPRFKNESDKIASTEGVSANILAIFEGIEVSALLDTGSTISIISEDFKTSHPALKKCPMKTSFAFACSVNGQCLNNVWTFPGLCQYAFQYTCTWMMSSSTSVPSRETPAAPGRNPLPIPSQRPEAEPCQVSSHPRPGTIPRAHRVQRWNSARTN